MADAGDDEIAGNEDSGDEESRFNAPCVGGDDNEEGSDDDTDDDNDGEDEDDGERAFDDEGNRLLAVPYDGPFRIHRLENWRMHVQQPQVVEEQEEEEEEEEKGDEEQEQAVNTNEQEPVSPPARAWIATLSSSRDAVALTEYAIENYPDCQGLRSALQKFVGNLQNLEFNHNIWLEESLHSNFSEEKKRFYRSLSHQFEIACADLLTAVTVIRDNDYSEENCFLLCKLSHQFDRALQWLPHAFNTD